MKAAFVRSLLARFKNFYVVLGVAFVVWLTFFDTNDLITQTSLSLKQSELEDTKAFYVSKIEEVKADRQALMENDELLEKIARERYFLKKETEDVFVVVPED